MYMLNVGTLGRIYPQLITFNEEYGILVSNGWYCIVVCMVTYLLAVICPPRKGLDIIIVVLRTL